MKIFRMVIEMVPRNSYQNIILRMPNWIGDIVMATPVIAAVKKHFQNAQLTVMCQYPASTLLELDPYIDEIFAFKRSKPVFLRRNAMGSVTENIRDGKYDLGILLTNSFSSAWWFFQGAVKKRIGYTNFPRNFLLTDGLHKPSKNVMVHQVDEYLNLLQLIGIKNQKIAPKLYLSDLEKVEAISKLKRYGIDFSRKIIGVCPGAAYGQAKCWPKEYFIQLLNKFKNQKEKAQFIFFGDMTQAFYIEEICRHFPELTLNLAGKTTIRELMGFVTCLDLFLTNDSGPMHIAEALGGKVLAIFGSTSKERTGPYENGKVLMQQVGCSPCYKRICPIDFRCMKRITPELVFNEIKKMID